MALESFNCVDKISVNSFDFSSRISKFNEANNKFTQIQEALIYASKSNEIKKLNGVVADILSKSLAYQRPTTDINKIIIPQVIDGNIKSIEFEFVAMDLGHSSVAHIILPINKEGRPLIVFRGTVPILFETIQSSFGFKATLSLFKNNTWGFGNNVVWDNDQLFSEVLKKIEAKYSKLPVLIGHSLGGVLAQRFALQNNNIHFIDSLFSFNSPGILSSECKKWHKIKQPKKNQINIINLLNDPVVNHFGSKRFIGRKFIFAPSEKSKKISHGEVLLNKVGQLEELSHKGFSLAKK